MTSKQFILMFVFFSLTYFGTVICIQKEFAEKYNKMVESCVVIK